MINWLIMDDKALKTCPFCKERIRKEAVKCRFCGEWLEQPIYSASSQPADQQPREAPENPMAAATATAEPVTNTDLKPPEWMARATPKNVNISQKSPEKTEPSSDDLALGEKVFQDLALSLKIVPSKEQWEAQFRQQRKTERSIPPQVLEHIWRRSEFSGKTPLPINVETKAEWPPIIPLLLIIFWIFWYALPKAIENGASSFEYVAWGTLAYCTTPGSVLILWRRKVFSVKSFGMAN